MTDWQQYCSETWLAVTSSQERACYESLGRDPVFTELSGEDIAEILAAAMIWGGNDA